jgi:hypothetical protein
MAEYTIIREQGEFMEPVPLTEEENKAVQQQDEEETDN